MSERSARNEVRNPLLAVPAVVEALRALDPSQREALRIVLRAVREIALVKERESYRKRKGPMVSYWMATATYAKHAANVIGRLSRGAA